MADELSGKKRRKENSEVADDSGRGALEARKRQKTEEEIQRAVAVHNVRGSLVSSSFSLADFVIIEEKSTRIVVADALEESGNFATEVEEGRGYMGPFEGHGPVRTSDG